MTITLEEKLDAAIAKRADAIVENDRIRNRFTHSSISNLAP